MACQACKKRAEERAAQLKAQAERLAKIKEQSKTNTSEARTDLLQEDVKYKSMNTEYFEAKAKLYGGL